MIDKDKLNYFQKKVKKSIFTLYSMGLKPMAGMSSNYGICFHAILPANIKKLLKKYQNS
jgi:hypothetical protein